jgi:hypothetical protein
LAGQRQQFGIDQQQFGGGVFEVATRLDPGTNRIDPRGGNRLDALLAAGHESEGPERMAVTIGAMTGRLSAAAMGKRERARKSVRREMEAGQEPASAAAEPGGLRAAGSRDVGRVVHLLVIIPAE